jgi:type IV pilus biogenesis protein CpaD/CtpE
MTPLTHLIPATCSVTIGLLGLLAGCTAIDPLSSENTWHPISANGMNIAAEVINPVDLTHGREPAGDTDGELAADAVLRLRTGHVRALPDSAITDLHVQSAPAAAGNP